MPVEPPVASPRSLAEAYALLADAPHRPVAGGTILTIQDGPSWGTSNTIQQLLRDCYSIDDAMQLEITYREKDAA